MRLLRWLCAFILASGVALSSAAAEPVKLKVMIFNIWRSGVQLSLLAGREPPSSAADPDIVALQEPEGNSRQDRRPCSAGIMSMNAPT